MLRFKNFREYVLRNADDGGGGGGGGGGDTGLDEKKVAAIVNDAISARLKRIDFSAQIGEAVDSRLTSFRDEILEAVTAPNNGKGGGDKKTNGTSTNDGVSQEVEALRKALAEERKQLAEERQQREAALEAQKRNEERSMLSEALVGVNVKRELLPGALAHLISEGKVVRTKDGKVAWATGDTLEPHADLTKGVTDWAASDTGKSYIDARPAKGSGNPGGSHTEGGKKTGGFTDVDLAAHILG